MPKRSNDFQRFVKRIYDQLAPAGATVTESASLPDYGAAKGPEIDILIEFDVAGLGRKMRIAIECRDHTRRSDKTWIDAIVGKYRDIEVDRVIAVSRTAFTKGALKKAKEGKVELRTLKEALDADWPEELMRLSVARVEWHPEIGFVQLESEPPWTNELGEPVAVRFGEQWLDQNEFKRWLFDAIIRRFADEVEKARAKGSDELDSLGTHPIALQIESSDLLFRSRLGTDHRLRRMTSRSSVTITESIIPVRRYKFEEIGVTEAPAHMNGKPAVIVVVQEPGKEPVVQLTPKE